MRKVLLVTGALLLLCLELAGQKPPRIVARNRVIDLDSFPLAIGGDTTVVFHYRNAGDSALVITTMVPTCTCVVPTYSKEPLMPGDSTTFSVRFIPSHSGPFSQAVTITYTTPGGTEIYLTRVGIKGTVTEPPCATCEQ